MVSERRKRRGWMHMCWQRKVGIPLLVGAVVLVIIVAIWELL